MAKKQKRAQAKYVKMGSDLRKARRNSLIILIASVVIGIALWAYISFSGINDHSIVTSVIIFGVVFTFVIIIGIIGNRFASNNTELNKLKREYNVTKEDIDAYDAKHR